MKVKIAFVAALFLVACSSSEGADGKDVPVTEETKEKTIKVQETNVQLEELDGDLDSLLTTLE